MPQYLSSYQSPTVSGSSSSSATYDYTGQDDHIKRQDELGQMRDVKTSALMGGDLDTAMKAAGRIRDLLSYTRTNAPGITERDPMKIVRPLVRIASSSQHSSSSSTGGGLQWHKPEFEDSMSGDPAKRREV